ncbi:hypothetical protein BJX65DRAFT_277411 [Aspergillus insuetus]
MLANLRAMFALYVPGTTLDKTWSQLSHGAVVSIRNLLDKVFSRLRSFRQDDGQLLGGVPGEGGKGLPHHGDFCIQRYDNREGIRRVQFPAKHRASPCHGDLKKCNIMAQQGPKNEDAYQATGIIDREDGGFYPEYYECTTL